MRPNVHQYGSVDVAAHLLGVGRLLEYTLVEDSAVGVGAEVVAALAPQSIVTGTSTTPEVGPVRSASRDGGTG